MKESHIELKVGLFVVVGLALLAVLVLSFSRGVTLFESTYKLHIRLPNAAGLKPTADVMMSGVPIGKATGLDLSPDGRSVIAHVSILSKNKIRTNAVFQIDALGFLGDQYISVAPSTNMEAGFFKDGDMVEAQAPFNMQEAVRSVSGLIDQAKKTVIDVDVAIKNINRTILSDQSLSNLGQTMSNMEAMTDSALKIAHDAESLIQSNTPSVNMAVASLKSASAKFDTMATDVDSLVASNRPVVDEAVRNLRDTSAHFKQLAADLDAGKGLAGGLLKDEEMKAHTAELISNANAMTAAFSAFGSNLNQRGIWSMLWKPKHVERSAGPAQ